MSSNDASSGPALLGPPSVRGTAALIGALVLVGTLAACGYRTGLAPALPAANLPGEALQSSQRLGLEGQELEYRDAVISQSIGIEVFGNESLLPNLERDLHAAFSRSARRHASLRLISPAKADLFIRGRIANFRRGTGSRTTNNRAVETLEIVTVDAELVDGSTGRVLGRAQARPSVGSAIDVPGREGTQRDRALRNAADRLLLLLLAGLEYGVTRPGDPLLPEKRQEATEGPRKSEGLTPSGNQPESSAGTTAESGAEAPASAGPAPR